jgi:hypothetical protein
MPKSQTEGEAVVYRVSFEPRGAWLKGIPEPWKYADAFAEIHAQIERHLMAMQERVASAHRESVRALERGDGSMVKPSGTEWSAEPVTVRSCRDGIVTRSEEYVTLTVELRLAALASSWAGRGELSEDALAALHAR